MPVLTEQADRAEQHKQHGAVMWPAAQAAGRAGASTERRLSCRGRTGIRETQSKHTNAQTHNEQTNSRTTKHTSNAPDESEHVDAEAVDDCVVDEE